jgi:alpha-L-fucosidase
MKVNSEGIHGTRPWKVFGEGPSLAVTETSGKAREEDRKDLTAAEIRFTSKGQDVYAFLMGWPEGSAVVTSVDKKVRNVELLGHKGKLKWSQSEAGLNVTMPAEKPSDYAVTLKIAT